MKDSTFLLKADGQLLAPDLQALVDKFAVKQASHAERCRVADELTATQVMERPATIDAASRIIAMMTPLANSYGYMLALYGSTLTNGRGRDIDVMAVPWRPVAAPAEALVAALCALGFEQVQPAYRGQMRTYAVMLIERSTGLLVDLQVREVPDGLRSSWGDRP